jgi:non-catalytic primase subunit PriX-like protein
MTSTTLASEDAVNNGLDYILSHFAYQIQLWPRTVSTKSTEARQVIVHNREEALAHFKQANFADCRISAYHYWRPTLASEFAGIKNAIAPNFIMIDLDASNFDDDYDELAHILRQTLWRIRDNLSGYKPVVIWSGRGYHILIRLQAPILETIKEFSNIDGIATKFIRFAESYLSDGKSDRAHNGTVSINNCMLRIPGSVNSKNGAIVTIAKKSKSDPANITLLIGSFFAWLESEKIKAANRWSNYNKVNVSHNASPVRYYWIEKLLQTPIPDYRRRCIWKILAPYLINVRKLSPEQSFAIISDWLDKCSQVSRLYFNPKLKINEDLRSSIKTGFYPPGLSKLYDTEKGLAELLQEHGVFTK